MPGRRFFARLTVGFAILLAAGLLMAPGFDAPAPELDEGQLVAYPAQVLQGRLPDRDFLTFYGPAEPWVVAAADEVLGASLHTERVVGMGLRLLLIWAVFLLALEWGLLAAAVASVIAAIAMVPVVAANAVVGVEAFGLLGLALLVRAILGSRSGSRRDWLLLSAGGLLGLSLFWRYDFAPATVMAAVPLWLIATSRERRRLLLGFGAGLVPYVIHVALVGPGHEWRAIHTAVFSESGRRLGLPALGSPTAQLLIVYALGLGAFFAAGIWCERRRRADPEGRALLAIGLYSAGLLPFAASLLEPVHILFASLAVFTLLPVALTVLFRLDPARRPTLPRRALLAAAAALLIALVAAPVILREALLRQTRYAFGSERPVAFQVAGEGRTWLLADPGAARDVQAMIAAIEPLARPRQSLFVGTTDLRGANLSDTELYFLLPRLRPASYYMELEQNAFNTPHSGLVDELHRADWLILTSRFPTKRLAGPGQPNQVVAHEFCLRASSGSYGLYQHCRPTGPSAVERAGTQADEGTRTLDLLHGKQTL